MFCIVFTNLGLDILMFVFFFLWYLMFPDGVYSVGFLCLELRICRFGSIFYTVKNVLIIWAEE